MMTKFKETELLKLLLLTKEQNSSYDKIVNANSFYTSIIKYLGSYRSNENEEINESLSKIQMFI